MSILLLRATRAIAARRVVARLLCRGLLVIANAAVQITHFRDKAILGNWLWVAWSWKHVAAYFNNFTFRLLPHSIDFLTIRLCVRVLQAPNVGAQQFFAIRIAE